MFNDILESKLNRNIPSYGTKNKEPGRQELKYCGNITYDFEE